MILTDSEKILVALGALVIILAIVANAIKDYKRMTREANKKVDVFVVEWHVSRRSNIKKVSTRTRRKGPTTALLLYASRL